MPAVQEKIAYLTFDDGPNEPYTSQILEILKSRGASATFFLCGKNAERQPDMPAKILAAGCAIGSHAYSHSWLKVFSAGLYDEIAQTAAILEKVVAKNTGGTAPVRLARAPWGLMRWDVRRKLLAAGFKIFHWDIAAYDWWQPKPAYIAAKIIREIRPGAVILLHDGEKTLPNRSRANTVAALPLIIDGLRAKGYRFEVLK